MLYTTHCSTINLPVLSWCCTPHISLTTNLPVLLPWCCTPHIALPQISQSFYLGAVHHTLLYHKSPCPSILVMYSTHCSTINLPVLSWCCTPHIALPQISLSYYLGAVHHTLLYHKSPCPSILVMYSTHCSTINLPIILPWWCTPHIALPQISLSYLGAVHHTLLYHKSPCPSILVLYSTHCSHHKSLCPSILVLYSTHCSTTNLSVLLPWCCTPHIALPQISLSYLGAVHHTLLYHKSPCPILVLYTTHCSTTNLPVLLSWCCTPHIALTTNLSVRLSWCCTPHIALPQISLSFYLGDVLHTLLYHKSHCPSILVMYSTHCSTKSPCPILVLYTTHGPCPSTLGCTPHIALPQISLSFYLGAVHHTLLYHKSPCPSILVMYSTHCSTINLPVLSWCCTPHIALTTNLPVLSWCCTPHIALPQISLSFYLGAVLHTLLSPQISLSYLGAVLHTLLYHKSLCPSTLVLYTTHCSTTNLPVLLSWWCTPHIALP